MRGAALVLLLACTPHATPKNVKATEAGITIALYAREGASLAVVDDRRWLEVTGRSIMLPNIDPGAALASLVIEPASASLSIGSCVRERLPDKAPEPVAEVPAAVRGVIRRTARPAEEPSEARFAPAVQCEVSARPGRYLVRILYVTTRLGYRAQHDIDVRAPDRATVTSRFAIAMPQWGERAELVLYDGAPGDDRTPREVVRGNALLDGSTAVLAIPARELKSELRRVYDGAVITTEDSQDVMWGHDSVSAVWVWLELAALHLAPGPVHVHLEIPGEGIRDLDVPANGRKQVEAGPLRLPLWIDESLRGTRQRAVEYNDGAALSERVQLSVANVGAAPREVWVEEHMREATKRRLDRAWPKKPIAAGDVLRAKLEVRPGRIERTGYTLIYEF